MPEDFRYPGPPKDWSQIQVLRRVWRAGSILRALHQPHFAALDLPMVEFDALAALGNTQGLRMKDLAEAMITTPSNVTRVCVTMEKKGLVERTRSSESDREVIARLTPAGHERFAELFPKTVNLGADLLDEALSAKEQQQLARLLAKLVAGLQSAPSLAEREA